MPRKWKENGDDVYRGVMNERTGLREVSKEWEENGEQQQKIEGVRNC